MPEPRPTAAQVRLVTTRAHACCEYCRSQARFSPDPFSIEHIIPRSRGGATEPENLALSCQGCNSRKYTSTEAADPVSGEFVALFNPRLQRWTDHFAWNEDFTLILGLSPVGRATVSKLQLNRHGLLELRGVLAQAQQHPPRDPVT